MAAQTQAGRGVLAEGSETLEPSEGYLKRHRTDGMGQSERLGVRCRVMGGGEGRGVNGNWNRLCVTKVVYLSTCTGWGMTQEKIKKQGGHADDREYRAMKPGTQALIWGIKRDGWICTSWIPLYMFCFVLRVKVRVQSLGFRRWELRSDLDDMIGQGELWRAEKGIIEYCCAVVIRTINGLWRKYWNDYN